jgi:hypothetical protein
VFSGGTIKAALALSITALLALGLAACGGGSSSTPASTTSTAQQSTNAPTTGQGSADGAKKPGGRGDTNGEPSGSGTDEASASFRTHGGDNSIQNFGDEAGPSEREEASAALDRYLQARAAGNWGRSCTVLAKAAIAPLEQLASSSPQLKGKDCGSILAALESRAPASTRANNLTHGVAALRVQGERGFALYRDAHGTAYFVPMVKEDGSWKVGALAPSEFP